MLLTGDGRGAVLKHVPASAWNWMRPRSSHDTATAEVAAPAERDLRVDFFRGLALLFIFLDHIPFNRMSWITIHHYGFSDAAEIFIFLAGYSAALAYGRVLRRSGFWAASARILRRCCQLYGAHLVLFVLFIGQVAYVTTRFHTTFFADEMQVTGFFQDPVEALVHVLRLTFRPAFFDILPLYIVLLLALPPVLWLLERRPALVVTASALLYGTVQLTHLNLPAYPPGLHWNFNPLGWQFLFIIGVFFGRRHDAPQPVVPRRPMWVALAVVWLGFACLANLMAPVPAFASVTSWVSALPIGKPNLNVLRVVHFLALAYVTVSWIGARPAFLRWRSIRPIIQCGQHSLPVFCAGVLLSLAAHMVLVLVRNSLPMQALVSLIGMMLLMGLAHLLTWLRHAEATAPAR